VREVPRMNNCEHIEKEKELKRERKSLRNIMATIPDSMLILDRELRIKSANRSFYKSFQTEPERIIGRKIADILGDKDGKLSTELARLFGREDTLENFEWCYQSEKLGERIFNITARGIIVAEEEEEEEEEQLVMLQDITRRKRAEQEIQRAREYAESIVATVREPLVILNADLRVVSANRSFYQTFRVSPGETEDRLLYELGNRQWDIPKLRGLLEDILPKNTTVEDFEVEHDFPTIGHRVMLLNARRTHREPEEAQMILLAIDDITERKRLQQKEKEAAANRMAAQVLEGMLEAVTILDLDGIIRQVNNGFERSTGWKQKEVIGKTAIEVGFLSEEEGQRIEKEVLPTLMKEGFVRNFETTVVRRNRTNFPVLMSWTLMKDVEGKPTRIVTAATDITELKRMEEALRESEERYRALVQLGAEVGEAVVMLQDTEQGEGVQTFVSDEWLRITGYSREELLGKPFFDLVSPGDRGASVERHRRKISGEAMPGLYEMTIIRKDGTQVPIELTSAYTTYRGKAANVAYIRDITERKRMERALATERERLEVTLRSTGDGVISTDLEGKVVFVNRVAEELTGWTQEEAAGKPLGEVFHIIHERTRKRVANPVEKVLKTGRVIGLINHAVLISRDGTERIIADSGAPVRDEEGNLFGVVMVFRDITEIRKLEEEVQKVEKLQSIGTLAGGIAHDFNNILTGILGNITLAKRYVEPESKAADRLLEAEKASLRARDLTQQLLTFAKGGAPIKKTTSIAELIQDSATFALRGSNARCEFSLPDDLWPVEVDEGQMNQVITNLVVNADQAMPEGGIINIGAKNTVIKRKGALPLPRGNYVEITVEDQGVGIPEEHLGRIFEPYFTTKQKGSGLGLATSYSIIKNHDGYITVKSELGVGTTFHIYIPASKKPAPAKKEVAEEALVRGQGRILVMDDEEIIREMLSRMLSLAGYEVELASNGAEAVQLKESQRVRPAI
jgi:PAS domain S-box-containing protein